MQHQSHPPIPEQPDSSSPSTERTQATQAEPFYTDEDIVILHDIVALAQEDLNTTTSPNPIPSAALFKAFDQVLPQYGLSPDDDKHLSSLIFRIGGEDGDAPLLNKFRNILENLGIVVEFGEDEVTSARASPAPSTARSMRSAYNRALRLFPRRSPQASPARKRLFQSKTAPDEDHEDDDLEDIDDAQFELGADTRNRLEKLLGSVGPKLDLDALARSQEIQRSIPAPQELSHNAGDPPPELQASLNRWIEHERALRSYESVSDPSDAGFTGEWVESSEHLRAGRTASPSPASPLRKVSRPANPTPPSLLSVTNHRDGAVLGAEKREVPVPVRSSLLESPIIHEKSRATRSPERNSHPMNNFRTLGRLDDGARESSHAAQRDHQEQDDAQQSVPTTQQAAATAVLSNAKRESTQHEATQMGLTKHQTLEMQAQQQKLMYRAARARELYLASKFFNHWADRTARRLEREAVARRHMIRFRCFRGWSHLPTSRDPAIEQMMISTAVQKLRRATKEQESQSRMLLDAAAEAYKVKLARQALHRWKCVMTVHHSRTKAAVRIQQSAVSLWKSAAGDQAAARAAALAQSKHHAASRALEAWQGQAEPFVDRLEAARNVGEANRNFHHLRQWWNLSECDRKARLYRQYTLTTKASHCLNVWNLAARAQAFKWNLEYQTTSSTFDRWESLKDTDLQIQDRAQEYVDRRRRRVVDSCLRQQSKVHGSMKSRSSRARLFIAGTRVLDVFDQVVTKRKKDEKEELKNYLMARYKQVSSTRKRRLFFDSLARWKNAAIEARDMVQTAEYARSAQNMSRLLRICDIWTAQQMQGDQLRVTALRSHQTAALEPWSRFTEQQAANEDFALESWAMTKQREALKDWSILSLQRSGQAHTASAAHQRHSRDKRRRVLNVWKQLAVKPAAAATPMTASLRSYRQSWRLLSDRHKSTSGRTSTVDTPTRWTGHSSLASSTMGQNPMPSVDEAGEQQDVKMAFEQDEEDGLEIESPTRPPSNRKKPFSEIASTTPRAPVPTHLMSTPAPANRSPAWSGSLAIPRRFLATPGPSQLRMQSSAASAASAASPVKDGEPFDGSSRVTSRPPFLSRSSAHPPSSHLTTTETPRPARASVLARSQPPEG